MSISINRDAEHLQFIHDRMVNIHGENPRTDYMTALQSVVDILNKPETTYEKLQRNRLTRFTV
jgi:hypothetical protein